MDNHVFLLNKWLELANDAFETSRSLMYEKISSKKPLHLPGYLLHLAIELYLKAFLMNYDISFDRHGQNGHNLNILFNKCLAINPNLENLCFQSTKVPYKQSYWIKYVNNYGAYGGLRYLSLKRPKWDFFVMIHDHLIDLVNFINNDVNKNKVINEYI